MSRLRLAAACALLKLAQEPCYHEIITLEQYQLCALVINVRTLICGYLCFVLGNAQSVSCNLSVGRQSSYRFPLFTLFLCF